MQVMLAQIIALGRNKAQFVSKAKYELCDLLHRLDRGNIEYVLFENRGLAIAAAHGVLTRPNAAQLVKLVTASATATEEADAS